MNFEHAEGLELGWGYELLGLFMSVKIGDE